MLNKKANRFGISLFLVIIFLSTCLCVASAVMPLPVEGQADAPAPSWLEYINSPVRLSYQPREEWAKPVATTLEEYHHQSFIRVKFKDHIYLQIQGGRLTNLCTGSLEREFENLRIDEGTWHKFAEIEEQKLLQMLQTAEQKSGQQMLNFFTMFTYVLPSGVDAAEVINWFNQLECVELAYPIMMPAKPGQGSADKQAQSSVSPYSAGCQGYYWNTVNGINAQGVWANKGITGRGVNYGIVGFGPPPTGVSNDLPIVNILGNPPFYGGNFEVKHFSIAGAKNNEDCFTGITYNSSFYSASFLPNPFPPGCEQGGNYTCADPAGAAWLAWSAVGPGGIIVLPYIHSVPSLGIEFPASGIPEVAFTVQTIALNGGICFMAAGNSGTNLALLGDQPGLPYPNMGSRINATPSIVVTGGPNANTFPGKIFYGPNYPDITNPNLLEYSDVSTEVMAGSAALIQSYVLNNWVSAPSPLSIPAPLNYNYFNQYRDVLLRPMEAIGDLQNGIIPPVARVQTALPQAMPLKYDGRSPLYMGEVDASHALRYEIDVFNDGSTNLTLSNPRFNITDSPASYNACAGSNGQLFTWESPPPAIIQKGGGAALIFKLCTSTPGFYEAQIIMNTNDPAAPNGEIKITVYAQVLGDPHPNMVVTNIEEFVINDQDTIDFGTRRNDPTLSPAVKIFKIKNTGTQPLQGSFSTTPNSSYWAVEFETPQQTSFSVPSGEFIYFVVRYRANSVGVHNNFLTIGTNAPDSQFHLFLHGQTVENAQRFFIEDASRYRHSSAYVMFDLGSMPANELADRWNALALQIGTDMLTSLKPISQLLGFEDQVNFGLSLVTNPLNALDSPITGERSVPLVVTRSLQGRDTGKLDAFYLITTRDDSQGMIVGLKSAPYTTGPNGVRVFLLPPGNLPNIISSDQSSSAITSGETAVPIGSTESLSTPLRTPLTRIFSVRNTSSQSIRITEYGSTDPHIGANINRRDIPAGGEVQIEVTLLAFEEGVFKSSIWFSTDTQPSSTSDPFFTFDVVGTVGSGGGGGGGCASSLGSTGRIFGVSGGTGSISVNASSSCSWTATSNASWISITGGSSGSGNGTVSYSVAPNTSAQRTGIINIGGKSFTVVQGGTGGGGPVPPNGVFVARAGTDVDDFDTATYVPNGSKIDYFAEAPNTFGNDGFWLVNNTDQTIRRVNVQVINLTTGNRFGLSHNIQHDRLDPHSKALFSIERSQILFPRRYEAWLRILYWIGDDSQEPITITLQHGPGQLFQNPNLSIRVEEVNGSPVPVGAVGADWSRQPVDGVLDLGSTAPGMTITKEIRIYNDNPVPIWLYSVFTPYVGNIQTSNNFGRIEPNGSSITAQIHFTGGAENGDFTDYLIGAYALPSNLNSLESSNGFWIPTKATVRPAPFAIVRDLLGYPASYNSTYGPIRTEVGQPTGRSFRIYNGGNLPLEISIPEVTGNGFSRIGQILTQGNVTTNGSTYTIAPDRTSFVDFRVRLMSAADGTYQGKVTFNVNDPRGQFKFNIAGEVVPVGTLNSALHLQQGATVIPNGGTFDSSEPTVFTINNNGTASISLGNLIVPLGYEVVRPLPQSIPAGGSGQFEILKSDPSAPKGYSAVVSFETDSPGNEVFEITDNNKPVAVDDVIATDPGIAVTINVTANDYDLDGDVINLITQPIITAPQHGTAVRVSDSSISYAPARGFTGVDSFEYEIGDGNGRRARANVTITVGDNNKPVAVDDAASTATATAVTINALANDYDPDGDPISLIANPIIVAPTHGTAVKVSQTDIAYTPAAGFAGTDAFQYEIGDGRGMRARAWVTVTVTNTNNKPVALDDSASTSVNTAVTINVTANDYDPDGDPVSLITDPIVVVPSHGTAVKASQSSITYTPATGFAGTDTFQYEIGDGRGKRARAWVSVTVTNTNTKPVAVNDSASTELNTSVLVDVTANDSDPDGDVVSLISQPIITAPAHGAAVKVSQTSISYTPATGFTGTDTFQYEIGDGRGMRARAWVTITITDSNQNPIAVNDTATTPSATSVTINVTANDSDPDGDPVSLITNPIIVVPSHGTAVKVSQSSITYTPASGFTGTDTFQYEIGDGRGKRARAWVSVTVTSGNNPPVAADDLASTNIATAVTINVTANDSDPDGDSVSLITNPIITAPTHGTAVNVSQSSITYTPAAGFAGTDSFEYEIGDGQGRRDRAWVTITVVDPNHAPVAVNDSASTPRNVAITINVTSNDYDVDGDAVNLISQPIIVAPAHGTAVKVSPSSITYTPTPGFVGTDTFQYEIGDGRGKRARAWVTVIVQ